MAGVLQSFNNINYSKETLDDGRIRFDIEVNNERFEIVKNRVYEKLAKAVSIEGFRPGKAPKNLITAQIGPKLYEETLQEIVPEVTLEVLQREKATPIDRIAYKVEKVGEGFGVKFSATFTSFPEFALPEIEQLKIKKKEVKVSKEEVDNVIKKMFDEDKNKKKLKFGDEWAKTLSLNVKSIKELSEKVKSELKRQKEMLEDDRVVNEVVEQISKKAKLTIPKLLIDQEVAVREQDYKGRIEKLGMKLEDFLRNQKTTMDELKKGWEKEAIKKIETEIILMKIAGKYKISVPMQEVEKQIAEIKDEKVKAQYNNENSKRYLQSVMIRQEVIKKVLNLVK